MPVDDRTPSLPFGQSDQRPEPAAGLPRGYLRGKVSCTCQECGKVTEHYHSQVRKFCSPACNTAHRNRTGIGTRPRNGTELKCEVCGKVFYVSPREIERRRFCSRACNKVGQISQVRTNCVTCGVEFSKHRGNIGGKFCTRACYLKGRVPAKTCKTCGKPLAKSALTYCSQPCLHEGRRTGDVRACETCGGIMYVEPHQKAKRFCSRACHSEAKRLTGPGCKIKRKDGYIAVYYPTHPDSGRQGTILEHRLVAEQKYGRRILKTEHVHHINGIKDDNRPENIEVIAPGDHARISNAEGVRKRQSMRDRLAEQEAELTALRAFKAEHDAADASD